MSRVTIRALRAGVVLAVLVLLLVQVVVLPASAQEGAQRYPEAAVVRAPVLVLAIGVLACVQVALVCAGELVVSAGQQRLARLRARGWAGGAVAAGGAGSVLVLVLGLYVSSTVGSPLYLVCGLVAALGAGATVAAARVRSHLPWPAQRHLELA